VGLQLVNCWSLASVVGEHFQDEVLEVIREAVSANFLPVCIELVVQNKVVEILVLFGLLEWENSLNDDE